MGFILCLSGKTELAIEFMKRAFRLNPIPLPHFYILLAMAYRVNGEYEKAIEVNLKGINDNPDQLASHLTLAASYISLNRTKKTYEAVKEVLRINPNFSLEYYANTLPFKNEKTTGKFVEALRKAGLPE